MTLTEAKEIVGICTKCKEHCPVAEPCCNSGVYFEGDVHWPEEED